MSHKFIDEALRQAGASNKTRSMFRAIYRSATARTAVEGIDGATILSDEFQINRGVVQGDITSPWYFILALELILRTHDTHRDKGVMLAGHNIHSLGYADDAALTDNKLAVATERVTAIAVGSKQDADMEINVAKTEVMHVCHQDAAPKTTNAEAIKVCKYKCTHPECRKVFKNKHGLKCHMGKCRWTNNFVMDRILAVKGAPGSKERRFKVRWEKYGEEDDTWEPHENLPPQAVKIFLKQNDMYDYNWPLEARCQFCDKPCKSAHGAKIHSRKCLHRPDPQSFTGTCADRCVKDAKMDKAQKFKPKVKCEGKDLENVAYFKYLGSIFAVDGQHRYDVSRRIALATCRCGALRQVFDSADISLELKLSIYKAAVASLLTYGSEAWRLTPPELMEQIMPGVCQDSLTNRSTKRRASINKRMTWCL